MLVSDNGFRYHTKDGRTLDVGDRVRIVSAPLYMSRFPDFLVGEEGTVKEWNVYPSGTIVVRFDERKAHPDKESYGDETFILWEFDYDTGVELV